MLYSVLKEGNENSGLQVQKMYKAGSDSKTEQWSLHVLWTDSYIHS